MEAGIEKGAAEVVWPCARCDRTGRRLCVGAHGRGLPQAALHPYSVLRFGEICRVLSGFVGYSSSMSCSPFLAFAAVASAGRSVMSSPFRRGASTGVRKLGDTPAHPLSVGTRSMDTRRQGTCPC